MCGRIVQAGGALRLSIIEGLGAPESRVLSLPARYNGTPSQELLAIRENHQTGRRSIDVLRWGLISMSGCPCVTLGQRGRSQARALVNCLRAVGIVIAVGIR